MMRKRIIAATICVTMLRPCLAQTVTEVTTRIETHIPPQSLSRALEQCAQIHHIQVLYLTADVRNLKTQGASGDLTTNETLTRLLRGTGLTYRYLDTGAIGIVDAGSSVRTSAKTSTTLKPKGASDARRGKTVAVGRDDDPVNVSPKGRPLARHATAELQEVVVTGTHIAGVAPISPVTIITSEDIKTSGLPDLASVIRALPQDFGGGVNPGVVTGGGVNGGFEPNGQATVNLRGMGAGSTLTLLDGHRMALSQGQDFVDISMIPTAAVDRVEIETDGASAIYGADAIAGVVNVILRKSYSGETTDAYVGGTADGGLIQRYSQLVGRTADGGAAGVLLGYQFDSADEILASQRAISRAAGAGNGLQPQTKSHGLFFNSHYDAGQNVSSYLQGLYHHRTDLYRWSGKAEQGLEDQFVLDGGLSLRVRDRTVDLDITDSGDSNSSATYKPVIPQANQGRLFGVSVSEQGSLFRLPGNRLVRSAFGAGFNKESFKEQAAPRFIRGERRVEDAYGEIDIPILPASTRGVGLEHLTLQAAGRYEHYSDFGAITEPKVSLAWSPVHEMTFSTSWGRSFRPPDLLDLYTGQLLIRYPGTFFGLPRNRVVMLINGSNPTLVAQTAKTWTESLKWQPTQNLLRGVIASASYYNIDFSGGINSPLLSIADALTNPLYAPFVVENPSTALQDAVSAGIPASNVFNFVPVPVNPADVQAIVFNRLVNLSKETIHGIDFDITYIRPTSNGEFIVDGKGSAERFDQQLLPGGGLRQVAGTIFNPPRFKAVLTTGWQGRAWGARLSANHVSGEVNTTTKPSSHVGSWTTLDGQVGYRVGALNLRVSAQNILNRAPPAIPATSTVPPGFGFDPDNYSAIGRFISLEGSVKW